MLLGLEPEDQKVIDFHGAGYNTLKELRTAFMCSPQARALFTGANLGEFTLRRPGYSIPPFLLRRPELPGVPWKFSEPSLAAPVSQLCTSEQMQGLDYQDLCMTLGVSPTAQHQKIWEYVYILAVLQSRGLVVAGSRGVGFGTGQEPLPSVFAKHGVYVTATDAPAHLGFIDHWAQAAQWTQGLNDLWKPELVPKDDFFERVQYRPADMNLIPPDLRGYDFCWSACCLEHLGSIRQGLDYIRNSLETLREGGTAVHTTEFNLQSDHETVELPELCLFRKRDIEQVIHEIVSDGHHVEPLNLWPGATPVDEHIDLPPFSLPHLKLKMEGFLTTSIGLIITKKS